ncbi:restriction endonuclease subunit S [uncultured Alloprevotella sp.]|uniref:restriction endonuclease subunit S n=1 Tax=uncultured Alloprevotella sp. TaxID=1283315 RepID=UPI002621C786|nr:restriction endonuclease subunit S [uncultured Alloprevotella sp.]
MEKKKPQIRFNGFEGEWTTTTLGECFLERVERSAEGELISVTISQGVVRASDLDRIDNSSNDKSNYKVVEVGDIAYNSMRMWQGACGYSLYKGICSPAYTVVIPQNNIDVVYCFYLFKRNETLQLFRVNSQGLTSDTWNLKYPAFSQIKCSFPSLSEQEKIGLFLTTLDKLIAKLEAKLDKLRKLKQALLEKMFTNVNRGGYETPEIRFKGYTDKWEVKELGEVAIFNPPNQPLKELFYYIDLESVEKGFLKIKEQVTKRMAPSRAQRTLEFNDILFQTVRPYLQNHYLFKKNTQNNQWVASTGYALLRPKIYPELLYTMLLSKGFMLEVMQRCTGSTYPAINSKKMTDIKVGCSSVQMEQQLIGDLFILLDNQLNKTSTKLTKLRNIKQSLLQKMFA